MITAIKGEETQKDIVTMFTCQLCGEQFPIYDHYKPVCICDECKKTWKQLKQVLHSV